MAQLVKNMPAVPETWVRSLGWEYPRRRERLLTSVFWPGELHGLYSPWGRKESDATFTVKVIIIIFVTFEFSDFIWICVLVAHSAECFFKIFY